MITESNPVSAEIAQTPSLWHRYHKVRSETEAICHPLKIEDYGVQTCPEVSPPKWHLAHTAWFFETLLLKPYLKNYKSYHPKFAQLFNSYYDTISQYHPRPERGLLSRPTVEEVYQYRNYVDANIHQLLQDLQDSQHEHADEIKRRIVLGLHHEQQHQELLFTDIKHIFAYNPLRPVYATLPVSKGTCAPIKWLEFEGGVKTLGAEFNKDVFRFDNEYPQHKVYAIDFKLASRPVTNAEYLEFMQDGAYSNSEYWLSDAWKIVQRDKWRAPLYWELNDNKWYSMTLGGMREVDPNEPVCHVSCYEAMAYARWAKKRLPTEMEWELVASSQAVTGNLRESGFLQPNSDYGGIHAAEKIYGDVWEWTQSPYVPYPGYRQAFGPMGEYNGKFMSNQMVLRGGSCVTPVTHIRHTYRNFFYPHERWQFCGIRLAQDS